MLKSSLLVKSVLWQSFGAVLVDTDKVISGFADSGHKGFASKVLVIKAQLSLMTVSHT